MNSNFSRFLIRGILGFSIGGFFLWLSLRQTNSEEIQQVLSESHVKWLFVALAWYASNMALRVLRWRTLIRGFQNISYAAVTVALLVGYAANNLLPARLGELFRANFTGRHYNLSRSALVGSIFIERVFDGLVVVLCLFVGQLFLEDRSTLSGLTVASISVFATLFLGSWVLSSNTSTTFFKHLPPVVLSKLQNFQKGLGAIRGQSLKKVIFLSLAIWVLESFALWSVFKAVGLSLEPSEMLLTIGVTSLSTLVPSAPGFVGTYQYSYALSLGLLGYETARGVVAATAFQVFLFGSVTIVGIGLYLYKTFAKSTV
ncbi:MAG: flippase-like domain-containing protein [Cyanobacteria bacterium SBC]|nr:flippase-like domain-containing protein [Cyanobacteria bacterium SBC]